MSLEGRGGGGRGGEGRRGGGERRVEKLFLDFFFTILRVFRFRWKKTVVWWWNGCNSSLHRAYLEIILSKLSTHPPNSTHQPPTHFNPSTTHPLQPINHPPNSTHQSPTQFNPPPTHPIQPTTHPPNSTHHPPTQFNPPTAHQPPTNHPPSLTHQPPTQFNPPTTHLV